MKAPHLDSPDFALRLVEQNDVNDWYSYLSLPHVVEHTSWDLRGPDDLRALIGSYNQPGKPSPLRFAVCETSSGRFVGTFGLNSISPETRSAELAYDLHPSYWGRGLGSACAEAVVHWANTSLGYPRTWALVLDTNLPSARLLQSIGFVPERQLPAYRIVRGEPRDFWLYGRDASPAGV